MRPSMGGRVGSWSCSSRARLQGRTNLLECFARARVLFERPRNHWRLRVRVEDAQHQLARSNLLHEVGARGYIARSRRVPQGA
eukprot:6993373-Prymnesium_polylepis.1